ncbi:hypothetical protein V1477_013989, partial [Vespula maculifrons]
RKGRAERSEYPRSCVLWRFTDRFRSSCTGTQVPTYPRHIRIRVPRVDCLHNEDSMTTVLELRRPTMCTLLGGSTQQSVCPLLFECDGSTISSFRRFVVLLAGEAVKRVGSTSTTNDESFSIDHGSYTPPIEESDHVESNHVESDHVACFFFFHYRLKKSQSSWWHPAVGNYSPSASNGTNEIFMGAAE